jgi:hypothetical protein
MGAPERRGSAKNYLVMVAGEAATKGIFDGIDLTWNRVPGGAAVGQTLAAAAASFDAGHPDKIVSLLLKAKQLMAGLHQPVVDLKRKQLEEAITLCSGLWLDATADKYGVVPGGTLKFRATALSRERLGTQVESVNVDGIATATSRDGGFGALPFNEPKTFSLGVTIPATEPFSQPYWLREPKQGETYAVSDQLLIGLPENPPLFRAHFHLRIESQDLEVERPVLYRYIERAQGERLRPVVVEPLVALQWPQAALLFPSASARSVELQVKTNVADAAGQVQIQAPAGWSVTPGTQDFRLSDAGLEASRSFRVIPPASEAKGLLEASAKAGGRAISVGMETISYPHIPTQVLFPPVKTPLIRADVQLMAKTIGYVMGAGDDVPEALRQLGADVVLLSPSDLGHGNFGRFDAIVTGVRAYNTRPDLRANHERLLEYVKEGGTLVVQYNFPELGGPGADPNTVDPNLARIGPYPITEGSDRVTVEDAQVKLPNPGSPLLHKPNEITPGDFEGWIQERGLMFASKWDSRYQPLFETHDPGEKPLLGGTLVTRYGKGAYVFTAFSWFRELPAGVPGAFRIFANLLSAGKTL